MDGDNHEVQELSELRSYVAKGFLSDLQVTIMTEKLRGATYSQLAGYASGPVALSHCLRRTALCLLWVPGMVTGPDPYLSPPDTERFRQLIVQACDDVNCVTVTRALSLALDLRRDRQRALKTKKSSPNHAVKLRAFRTGISMPATTCFSTKVRCLNCPIKIFSVIYKSTTSLLNDYNLQSLSVSV